MPSIRIGFASDFTLKNNLVGFGTTTADRKLEVAGTLKGDLQITGIATLTEYGGFAAQKQNITQTTNLGFSTTGIGSFQQSNELESGYTSLVGEFNTLSDDLIVDDGKIFEIKTTSITGVTTIGTQSYDYDTSRVDLGTLESVSIQSHFTLPNGGIETRPENPIEGTVRFNDDLNTLEFYNGIEWRQFAVTGASGRGVFGGGGTPTAQSTIEFINTSSLGNAKNFGDLSTARTGAMGCSSAIRGLYGGGGQPVSQLTNIEYITIASQGNGISFGSLSEGREYSRALASSTRGIFGGGQNSPTGGLSNVIDYVEIPTLGTALDFGDLLSAVADTSACSSPTRGLFGGGYTAPGGMGRSATIQSLTISSKGDTVTFGELTDRRSTLAACSNSVRGMFGGGAVSGAPDNKISVIDYVTIASFGNSVDFGDLTQRRVQLGSLASQTRGFWAGGYATAPISDFLNIIDYVTIASVGNAQDFGDLTQIKNYPEGGVSDSHGGLGGF